MLIWCWTLCLCVDWGNVFSVTTLQPPLIKRRKNESIWIVSKAGFIWRLPLLHISHSLKISFWVYQFEIQTDAVSYQCLCYCTSRLSLNESAHTKSERKSPTSRQPISFWQSVSRDPGIDACVMRAGVLSCRWVWEVSRLVLTQVCVCGVVLPRPVLQMSCRKVTERLLNDGNHCSDVMNKRVLHSFYLDLQASILISIGYI